MSAMRATQIRRLPGFGLTLGFTLFYVTLMIVIPIAALLLKASSISMEELVETFKTPRVQASLRLTFGASLLAAAINTFFGFIAAFAGALSVCWPPSDRLFDRSSFRHADCCLGDSIDGHLRTDWNCGQALSCVGY